MTISRIDRSTRFRLADATARETRPKALPVAAAPLRDESGLRLRRDLSNQAVTLTGECNGAHRQRARSVTRNGLKRRQNAQDANGIKLLDK